MARKKPAVTPPVPATPPPVVPPMTWSLSDPGMDLLERAGLAGLFMALQAARAAGHDLSPLEWDDADLKTDSVTVRWVGPARPAFVKLMAWAWQVRDGVFYFPAVHDDRARADWWQRVTMHNGLMGSYFQMENVQPKLEAVERVVQVGDDDRAIKVTFQPPAEFIRGSGVRANKAAKIKSVKKGKRATRQFRVNNVTESLLFDKDGHWHTQPIEIGNWVCPGVTSRDKIEPSWLGPSKIALLLLLAPTVVTYLKLPRSHVKIKKKRVWCDNWAIIAPDVRDLCSFATLRRSVVWNLDFTDAASLGDAGLHFMAEYASRDFRSHALAGCRVIAMGKVNYYPNQSIRKAVLDITGKLNAVIRYRTLQQVFPNQFKRFKNPATDALDTAVRVSTRGARPTATPFAAPNPGPQPTGRYKLPTGRGRIADNLVSGRPWYENLFVPMPWDEKELEQQRKQSDKGSSTERVWFNALASQRSELMRLIQEDDMWDSEAERFFAEAFWEALDSLYKQEVDATKHGGSRTIKERWKHLNEDIRRGLMQAKTRALLRANLSEFFAKAGRTKTFRTYTPAIWRLIDHADHWKKGRDLALVALASHRRRSVREGKETEIDPACTPAKGN